jgi:hypothetical protein
MERKQMLARRQQNVKDDIMRFLYGVERLPQKVAFSDNERVIEYFDEFSKESDPESFELRFR